jgi:hypothetical protein
LVVGRESLGLLANLCQEVGVLIGEGKVEQLEGGVRPGFEAPPECQLIAQRLGVAQDLLGFSLVVPEPGRAYTAVEIGEQGLLRGEVKDAPRSPGSS